MADNEWAHDPEERALGFERSRPGWWLVTGDFPELFVRARLNDNGRAVIVCMVLAGEDREPNSTDLRRIPLARITAHLNAGRNRSWAEDAPEIDFLADLRKGLAEPAQLPPTPKRPHELQRPPSQGSDEFYRQVADVYRYYAEYSYKPATEIAAEADVPVATARRWINEARKRGHLGPGQRGRATG